MSATPTPTPTLGQRLAGVGRALFAGMPPPPAPVAPLPRYDPVGWRAPRAQAKGAAAPLTSSNDPASVSALAKTLAGGQATQTNPDHWKGQPTFWLAPDAPEQQWSGLALDEGKISDYPPHKLLELLADLSPDVSRALWDTTRMLAGEWSLACFRPGSTTPDPAAQAVCAQLIDRITARHGSFDVFLARCHLNGFLRGGYFLELVLDQAARQALDIALPDPISARFRMVDDLTTGGVRWQLGQVQKGQFVPLDRPTICYLPLDPLPGVPYGRPPFAAALFPAVFLLALLHDIRRVVAQQGYPRLDIAIDFDAMLATMPPEAAGDTQLMADWAQAHIDQIVAVYSKLPPDAAYVHASTISVNKPVGAVDATSLGGIAGLIEALERMLVRALKTMPLLMGISDGVSEANANRQWEIQLSGLRHPQRLLEGALERLFTLALRAAGLQAQVNFTFRENRKSEEQRDEQVKQLKLVNAVAAYEAGFVGQDEAAQWAVGHDADVPEPRQAQLDPPRWTGAPGAAPAPPKGQVTTQGGNKPGTPPKGGDGQGKDKRPPKPAKAPAKARMTRAEWEGYYDTLDHDDVRELIATGGYSNGHEQD